MPTLVIVLLLCGLCLCTLAEEKPAFPGTVEIIRIDPAATGYATFQSHNQKVLQNQYGLFEAHIRTRNEEYTKQQFRLSRSIDGGKTFTTVYEATYACNPPPIETDAAGNIYLAQCDFENGNAYLYRFLAAKEFKDPEITTIPNGSGGKWALCIDLPRKQLYFFSNNNTFAIIGVDGTLKRQVTLTKDGPNGMIMYPQLCLEPDGTLHAAWTSQKHGIYMYRDIHHILSRDGGQTWQNLDGTKLAPPIVVDETGPALRITLDDEYDVHTWLSNMLAHGGKLHFTYAAQFPAGWREHYLRYDIATGKREIDLQPEFKGATIKIQSLDGFFASRAADPKSPIYCVMSDNGRIGCLESTDNGTTWHDYARSDEAFNPYSVGGCREITPDGYIIGTFTDQRAATTDATGKCPVYLIKIKAR